MNSDFDAYVDALRGWVRAETLPARGTEQITAADERGRRGATVARDACHERVRRLTRDVDRRVQAVRADLTAIGAADLLDESAMAPTGDHGQVTDHRLEEAYVRLRASADELSALARRAATAGSAAPGRQRRGGLVIAAVVAVLVVVTAVAMLAGINTGG